jgi:hypothetical protein
MWTEFVTQVKTCIIVVSYINTSATEYLVINCVTYSLRRSKLIKPSCTIISLTPGHSESNLFHLILNILPFKYGRMPGSVPFKVSHLYELGNKFYVKESRILSMWKLLATDKWLQIASNSTNDANTTTISCFIFLH